MFFESWASLGRVVLVAVILFILVVLMLRVVGQQALAEMSGYDLVFTVTVGAVVAAVAIDRRIPIVNAITAIATVLL
nr:hypothetical protein [Gemmatimonadota bacterium]